MPERHDPASPAQARARLRAQLDDLLIADRRALLAQWRRLPAGAGDAAVHEWQERVAAARARRDARAASVPQVSIDASLPIAAKADEIVTMIRRHRVLVVAGETGSGKSTQLPKLCLAAGRGIAGMVGCTQPRRVAARSIARRVAAELGTPLGERVGYQVRFSEQTGDRTLIKFMTDGILLAETQSDPWLNAYDTLVIDEAHERSLNIDFLLGYLKRLMARRHDLKLIVTSATIDTALFARHFDGAPVLQVEGRAYPVEVRWRPEVPREPLGGSSSAEAPGAPAADVKGKHRGKRPGRTAPAQTGASETRQIVAAMDEIDAEGAHGDVLVFLPGEREIRDAHQALARRNYRGTEILALYARLSAAEQDRVFRPGAGRRIVLATNVAETSLTVPRIRYVIDAGTARVKRYSPRSQLERLHVEPISQAAADQRMGRCGRIGPGVCVRLYDAQDYAARPQFSDPEILRASLAGVILRMLNLRLGDVDTFPFIEAPDPRAIGDGWRRLAELQAVDANRRLTPIGRTMAQWPIDVALARMVVEARAFGCLPDVLVLVAFLSIQDPRERPADARAAADAAHEPWRDAKSDFVSILNLWQAHSTAHADMTQARLRDWCRANFLSYMRMREWRELHRQLLGIAAETRVAAPDAGAAVVPAHMPPAPAREAARHFERLHRCLLSGWPAQVARKEEKAEYRATRDRKLAIFPGSTLARNPPSWLMAGQIIDLQRVYAMSCARVEPAWIEQQAAHLVRKAWHDPHWSRQRGSVMAFEQVSLFGLVLVERRPVQFARQDAATAHAIFVRAALARCDLDSRAACVRANARVLDEAHAVEARRRRSGLLKSDDELAAFFDDKVPQDISSVAAFDAWYRRADPARQAALCWSLDDVLASEPGLRAADFPATLSFDGHALKLEYRFVPGDPADGVSLVVPLALVNAVPAARCEWLVPGLLPEKVATLIRGLPKALRRNFVPAPDFARAFAQAQPPCDAPLSTMLAAWLARISGVAIGSDDFTPIEVPAHLRMRFVVRDPAGAIIGEGRDIDALRDAWGAAANAAFSRHAEVELAREDVDGFDFDEIPVSVTGAGGVSAYPALLDLGESVALRVFERADEARAAHRGGVQRLLRVALRDALKQARRQLPMDRRLALKYAAIASVDALREDIVEAALADLLASRDLDIRQRAGFMHARTQLSQALFAEAVERLSVVEDILAAYADLAPWLQPPLLGYARANYDDLREQRDALVYPGFARDLPRARLAHLPRYLKAMRLRAERLREDASRDQARMLTVRLYVSAYLRLRAQRGAAPELDALRWLIEELRVSLFAQELKTAEPVSAKRLAKLVESLESGQRGDAQRT